MRCSLAASRSHHKLRASAVFALSGGERRGVSPSLDTKAEGGQRDDQGATRKGATFDEMPVCTRMPVQSNEQFEKASLLLFAPASRKLHRCSSSNNFLVAPSSVDEYAKAVSILSCFFLDFCSV
eukprot:4467823-Pleurochrysis_carterae.AAC.2